MPLMAGYHTRILALVKGRAFVLAPNEKRLAGKDVWASILEKVNSSLELE